MRRSLCRKAASHMLKGLFQRAVAPPPKVPTLPRVAGILMKRSTDLNIVVSRLYHAPYYRG